MLAFVMFTGSQIWVDIWATGPDNGPDHVPLAFFFWASNLSPGHAYLAPWIVYWALVF